MTSICACETVCVCVEANKIKLQSFKRVVQGQPMHGVPASEPAMAEGIGVYWSAINFNRQAAV